MTAVRDPRHVRPAGALAPSSPAARDGVAAESEGRSHASEWAAELPAGVRIGQDHVVRAGSESLFISGHLHDPESAVAMVLLHSSAGPSIRLDEIWARTRRRLPAAAGVLAGAAAAPQHLPEQVHDEDAGCSGFIAFVPTGRQIGLDERFSLEVMLVDGGRATLPLRLTGGDAGAMLPKLLATVDGDDPMIDRLVAAHLGPLVAAYTTPGAASSGQGPSGTVARPIGRRVDRAKVSMVVPLDGVRRDMDVNLARLCGDPDMDGVELVVVAPRAQAAGLADLLDRYAGFCDVGGMLVIADGAPDDCTLLEIGSAHASGEFLLFMSGSVLPAQHGWISRLLGELGDAEDAGLISPALLYEDGSVCFAGTAAPTPDRPVSVRSRLAGYPQAWLDGAKTAESFTGALACCLLPRSLFAEVGGFGTGDGSGFGFGLLGAEFKNMDLALRLAARGKRCYCTPEVTLYKLDDAAAEEPAPWRETARRVDQWTFARKWPAVQVGRRPRETGAAR